MAAYDLRKYKYAPASSRPATVLTSSKQSADNDRPQNATNPVEKLAMDTTALKADIIASLRKDIATVIREELKNALAADFERLGTEMQAIRSEIASSNSGFRLELEAVKSTVEDVEGGLSMWSDETTTLKGTVATLEKQIETLNKKQLDMESRMRRGNVRIAGIDEKSSSSSPAAVSKLLKELFQLDRDVRVDRSHRSLTKRKAGDNKPRIIIAKLHSEGDAEDILKMARDGRKLQYKGRNVAVFPDLPESIAKARGAFTPARLLLKNRRDVRYGIKFPSTFIVTYNNVEKEFLDANAALVYAKSITESTEPTDAPETGSTPPETEPRPTP